MVELAGHARATSLGFHDALACGFAANAPAGATARGITTLVFSGGVIHNRLLRARLAFYLSDF